VVGAPSNIILVYFRTS